MQVKQITTVQGLDSLVRDWRQLTRANPFLSPEWLHTWWRHLGSSAAGDTQLSVLCVTDDRDELVAVAPWYLERSLWRGRTLRFLGSGKVCTEYLSLPCRSGFQQPAVTAIADWLHQANRQTEPSAAQAWDVIWLEGVDTGDPIIRQLFETLGERGAITHSQPAADCWRLELPPSWEDYLAILSKSHRKQVRRLQRAYFDTGRARTIRAEAPGDLEEGFRILVDLHERRWRPRGAGSVFVQGEMVRFHREATERLLESGQLRLNWLVLDGQPVAAEYSLTGGGVLYAYQSGMAPEAEQHAPGTLAFMATLRAAIEEGYHAVDLLRGDEPYKQHWRAVPRSTHDVRILRPGLPGHLRDTIWQAGSVARNWLRAGRNAVRGASRTIHAKSFQSLACSDFGDCVAAPYPIPENRSRYRPV